LWSAEKPTFNGKFVQFKDAYCRPQPVKKTVPIIVGGHSEAAAKRAGRLGDGYFPARDAPADMIALARAEAQKAGRNPNDIEITASMPEDLDRIPALQQLGVTRLLVPASPMAGLKQMIRGPEDVVKFKEIIQRYA
jgi:alkanesulfonate monooxygenase SsuD/methylene tetrahydromethanopterin reductase-like flavin-dependent oxidoreductase (luciferase family)